jgi:hypothetical protein
MESLDELSKSSGKGGFFKHVFNFDEESKADMLNLIQYIFISLVPIVILNKLMQKYVPEADDEKGSLEIMIEVLAQVLFMFFGILIIHRVITYVPTYSGEKYPVWNVIGAVIPMLVILISLQTKLGEKISILFERIVDLWEGPKDTKNNNKKGKTNVKVSQPISQNQMAVNQSLNAMGSTSISDLPISSQSTQSQQLPNYDQMYQQDSTPLIGAASPGMDTFEPMAANGTGSGVWGSAFGW